VNRLANETSPYLRQHRDNPVDWYPWGEAALAEARRRDVPVLLSVGYSTCHWCHVMEHESFEDARVASLLNDAFVSVKVDREERPDVDALYMEAVQAMTGRGGWPMTVFLRPDGLPFYGGTYFPKSSFLQLLAAIDDVWHNRRADVDQNVGALGEAISRSARLDPDPSMPTEQHQQLALDQLARAFDADGGGFGRAPKFPNTFALDLILRVQAREPSQGAARVLVTTLDAMASGGVYDHLGGGFARYSTDDQWLVPHFEKMLYDQALLARTYVRAALLFDAPRWRQVAAETIDYVVRDLRHPAGGFCSAEDADSPGPDGIPHEGWFSTWTVEEVGAVLGDDADALLAWYEFTEGGNFENRTIPSRLQHRGELERPPEVETLRRRLFEARERRPRPGLDDKVLTEWNALMVSTLAEAAAAFGRDDWRHAAVGCAEFLLRELRSADGRWHRSWHPDGTPPARHAALAGDHAALVDAFTRLAELTGQARWIAHAIEIADVLLDHFWDVDRGGVFTTADDAEQLVVRQKDLLDGATPSTNALTAWALLRLGALTGERRYVHHAERILQLLATLIPQAPSSCSLALAAADLHRRGAVEVVVTGDRPDLVAATQRRFLPNGVLAWGERYDSPLWEGRPDGAAYVCRDGVCDLPVTDLAGLLRQLAAAG
jgi:hypothetical protein